LWPVVWALSSNPIAEKKEGLARCGGKKEEGIKKGIRMKIVKYLQKKAQSISNHF